MRPKPRPPVGKLLVLSGVCVLLFLALALLTRQPQVALFAAVLVQMVGVFMIAPWKGR
jgi:hypothetical protein